MTAAGMPPSVRRILAASVGLAALRLARRARAPESRAVFNLLDAQVSDIDEDYASRLQGEPAGGIADVHFRPAQPRSARVALV